MKPRALITGAGRGIGRAIAQGLAEDGYRVIVNYHANDAAAQATHAAITEAGGEAVLAKFNVRDADAIAASYAELDVDNDPIAVLVNNAGIAKDALFPSMTGEAWRDVIGTTLDGFYNVTHPLVMPMVRAKRGRIVNIASVSGLIGNRGQANYSAAKAGLIGATRTLALELAKRRITVNAVAPGLIETDMVEDAPLDMIMKHIPMRRLGSPEEVAHVVRFLVSDNAAYITGQVIGINGGLA